MNSDVVVEPRYLVAAFLENKHSQAAPSIEITSKDKFAEHILALFNRIFDGHAKGSTRRHSQTYVLSDSQPGVQWNLAFNRITKRIYLGVNLEGIAYDNWPITDFIQSEQLHSELMQVIERSPKPEKVRLRFYRDAWRVQARPSIEEQFLGGSEFTLSDLSESQWQGILDEALQCLNEKNNFRGRGRQLITLCHQPSKGPKKRQMPVSPHLYLYTELLPEGDTQTVLTNGFETLMPLYDWVESKLKD